MQNYTLRHEGKYVSNFLFTCCFHVSLQTFPKAQLQTTYKQLPHQHLVHVLICQEYPFCFIIGNRPRFLKDFSEADVVVYLDATIVLHIVSVHTITPVRRSAHFATIMSANTVFLDKI